MDVDGRRGLSDQIVLNQWKGRQEGGKKKKKYKT